MPTSAARREPPSSEAFILEHGRLPRPLSHPAFDPFRRRLLKLPTLIRYTTAILSLILVPLRITLALTATSLAYLVVKLFGPSITDDDIRHFRVNPLPPWRRAIVRVATRFLARSLLLALGFWTLPGDDHPDFDPSVASRATVVANHSSLADPCLLAYLFAPAFVAKSNVYAIPGVGSVGAAQHAFYIDRMHGTRLSITHNIAERQNLVAHAHPPIPHVAIFPEGTTTNGHHLLRFKTGAFVAGQPVVPVLIRYDYDYFSPTYETINTAPYLIGLLSQLRNRLRYYRLPVYFPSDDEKKDPTLYADNVHKLMLEQSFTVFGHRLVASNSNYVDKIEYHSIVRNKPLKKGLQLNKDS